MFTNQRVALPLALLFVVALAAMVSAQVSTTLSTCDVPFAFTAGNQDMPAGKYVISERSPGVIEISTADRRHMVSLVTRNVELAEIPAASKLLFHQYGDRYFLTRVVQEGNRLAGDLAQTRAEKELVRAQSPKAVEVAIK